jgi:hypothetical protein
MRGTAPQSRSVPCRRPGMSQVWPGLLPVQGTRLRPRAEGNLWQTGARSCDLAALKPDAAANPHVARARGYARAYAGGREYPDVDWLLTPQWSGW